MNKIRFADNTEIEVNSISQVNDMLSITINTDDINSVISQFRDTTKTSVMRYYSGTDLLRGYSGFTQMEKVSFTPDVVISIDYNETDSTTESGFVEEKADQCIISMKKVPEIVNVANQTEQNTANIDYIAMETGIEL